MSTKIKPKAAPETKNETKETKKSAEQDLKRRPYSDLSGIRFLVDREGNRTEAVVPMEVFRHMLDDLEDLEDIQDAYEAEKEMEGKEWIPLEQVIAELNIDVSGPAQ